MTQLTEAKKGVVTKQMELVARDEGLSPEEVAKGVAEGVIVIPKNINHNFPPRGIGKGLRTKVNANIGTSAEHHDLREELTKLEVAVEAGADSVMDLSTGGDLDKIRREILNRSPVMVGTVPIYQAVVEYSERNGDFRNMDEDFLFSIIERQAKDGVDFVTVHCGVTRKAVELLEKEGRVGGIVSRGGAFLASWMEYNDKENPLYTQFDRLLEIAKKYDVTLSLGDGLRPGAIADASDKAQFMELITLGELADLARKEGVQVMIEGPGHVPLDQIEANVRMEKELCNGAPFYVLGPLTTDIAPGYDHITGAIGGAIAAAAGADFLCYVTPAEHLRLPNPSEVRMGVIAARIAAHSADIVKGVPRAQERDQMMSEKRRELDWEGMYQLALDPDLARRMRKESEAYMKEYCTMCGKYCSIRLNPKVKKLEVKK